MVKYLIILSVIVAGCYCQNPGAETPQAAAAAPPRPKINWGKCPQLEPKEADIINKSRILQECLQQFPRKEQITEPEFIEHQRSVTECALKKEDWYDNKNHYKFAKAEQEIKNKKLSADMEQALLASHGQCSQMAKDRASQDKLSEVEKVQIYQGCMDAHITQACQIQIGIPA